MTLSEEVYIDLSNVPLKPMGKKEITQLEMALIIGVLYSPEVLELIKDPIERLTWIDSLAVAAAAFARHKAGMPTTQIAEEIGRSETTVRSHLAQKTKAGKLVAETYEKLKRGELRLVVPFIRAPVAGAEEQMEALRREVEALREQVKALEQQVENLKRENEELKAKLSSRDAEVENLRTQLATKESEIENLRSRLSSVESELESLRREREEITRDKNMLAEKLNNVIEEVKKARQLLSEVTRVLDQLAPSTS
ncbi:MAG: transcriptional regulator [Desulfurococcaceae archaeon]